jgi:midasin (ATPase involved in ribosome maturation)
MFSGFGLGHFDIAYRYLEVALLFFYDLQPLETDISGADSVMSHLNEVLDKYRKRKHLFPEVSAQDLDTVEQIKSDLMHLKKRWQAIFLWQDGPLVQAMKNGDLFLIDEISLADDSVLERLNSVLEPERKLVCPSFFIRSYVQITCFFGY